MLVWRDRKGELHHYETMDRKVLIEMIWRLKAEHCYDIQFYHEMKASTGSEGNE